MTYSPHFEVSMQKEQIVQFLKNDMSYTEISKVTGISKCLISYYFKKYSLVPSKKYYPLDKDILSKMYVDENLSSQIIADKLNVTQKSVLFWLKKYEIKIQDIGRNQFKKISLQEAIDIFKKNGHTLISSVYKNCRTKMDYICRCGNVSSMTITVCKRGTGCKKCACEKLRKYPIGSKKYLIDYQRDPEFRKKCAVIQRERYPEKYKARQMLKRAVESKKIDKPLNCQVCMSSDKRIEGHHEDYSKPLDVIWMCSKCHSDHHRIAEVS